MLQVLGRNFVINKFKDIVVAASCTAYHGNLNPAPPPLVGTWSHLSVRHSFIGRVTEEELWDGVTSVSSQGRKGGRQKKLRGRIIKLSKPLKMGVGPAQTELVGLNTRLKGTNLDLELVPKVLKSRDKKKEVKEDQKQFVDGKWTEWQKKKKLALNRDKGIPPMQRGYHGTDTRGRGVGPIQIKTSLFDFENFDTRLIDLNRTSNKTTLGTRRSFRVVVAVGNGNGVGGYAVANAPKVNLAINKAIRKAALHLQFFERYNGHTIFHDFFSQENKTKLTFQRKNKGHGVVGSLVIRQLCRLIGLHDVYVKTEGSMKNYMNVTKAFFGGLEMQETHQELANRTKLHVVETRRDRGNYPVVVASPEGDVAQEELGSADAKWLTNDTMYMGGKVKLLNRRRVPIWIRENTPSWRRKKKTYEMKKGQKAAKLERLVGGFEPDEEEMKKRRVARRKYYNG